MKILKIVLLSVVLVSTQSFAVTPVKSNAPGTFILSQESLQTALLNNNLDIIQGLYAVHDAKDRVNIARANLLPSLNLSGMVNFSGGGLFLSGFDFLLPFLVPSNWYNFATEKNLFQSEKISYNILQVNTLASALSLYFTLISDQQLHTVFSQEYHDTLDVYEIHKQRSTVGLGQVTDVMQIQAQAQLAGIRASQVAELSKQEIAALRKFMALPLQTEIILDDSTMASSPYEYETLETAARKADSVSLEKSQIQYLIKAAQLQKWSRVFSIINGISVGGRSIGIGVDADFRNMQATGSMNFGFAQFPTYELSERQIQEIRLLEKNISLENVRQIESNILSLEEARHQLELSIQADAQMAQVYQLRLKEYEQGAATWLDVIISRVQWRDTALAKVRSQLDVNLRRVALHRTLLTANFSTVKGCNPKRMPVAKNPGLIRGVIDNIRGKNRIESHATLDQICRGK